MKKIGIIALSTILIAITALVNVAGQSHLDRRIAAGEKIASPICAVNLLYDQPCDTVEED